MNTDEHTKLVLVWQSATFYKVVFWTVGKELEYVIATNSDFLFQSCFALNTEKRTEKRRKETSNLLHVYRRILKASPKKWSDALLRIFVRAPESGGKKFSEHIRHLQASFIDKTTTTANSEATMT